jgi:hypothetical protein
MKLCLLWSLVALFAALVVAGAPVSLSVAPTDGGCDKLESSQNNCLGTIQSLLNSCQSGSPCELSFAAGTYYIHPPQYVGASIYIPTTPTSVSIYGAALDATGTPTTMLVLLDVAGLFISNGQAPAPFQLNFANFSIDSYRMPFDFGTATSASTVQIAPLPLSHPHLYTLNFSRYPWLNEAEAINTYYMPQERWTGGLDYYALSNPVSLSYGPVNSNGCEVTLGSPILGSYVGQTILLRHRVYAANAFMVFGGSVAWDSVFIYNVAGMGIYASRCNTISINRVYITTPPDAKDSTTSSYRPISLTADGIHIVSQALGSQLTLQNSRVEMQGDDCVNVNTPMERVSRVASSTELVAAGYSNTFPFQAGDVINVLDGQTLQFKQQVSGATLNAHARTLTLTAAGASWNANVGDLLFAANFFSDSVTIADNYFGKNRARGLIVRGFNLLINGNTFDRNSGPAFLAVTDGCYFFEGVNVINVNFLSNIVVAVNAGPAACYGAVTVVGNVPNFGPNGPTPGTCTQSTAAYNYNVSVQSNTFVHNVFQPGNGAMTTVWIATTDGVGVTDNTITRQSGVPVPTCELYGTDNVQTSHSGNVCNGGTCTVCGL